MPTYAVSAEMEIIATGDAAEFIKIVGVWASSGLNQANILVNY